MAQSGALDRTPFLQIWIRSLNKEIGPAFTRVNTYFTAMWLGYPIIWALGPLGLGLLDSLTEVALFVILPIFSKVGFSIYDLHELRKLAPKFPQYDEPDPRSPLRQTVN
ncbi:MAG: bacteriorhodopsin [Erythrobacter sp.]